MHVLDNNTILLGCMLLLLAAVVPLINALLIKLSPVKADIGDTEEACEANESLPNISVIITADGDGEDLRDNLPAFLGQIYTANYQIIIVVANSDDLTESVLKQYSNNPRLYTTFIPSSSRYMSRRKLAITVGIKAAKYEWIVLTDVDCRPDTNRWLQVMARKCQSNIDIILGYSCFADNYKSVRRFDHTYMLYRQMQKARNGTVWGYTGNNLMFRKKMFIDGKGFEGNLKYIRGEYDFIVNKFSDSQNTATELSTQSWIREYGLSDKGWRNKNLFYMSTRKLLKHTFNSRLFFNVSMLAMVLYYLFVVSSMIYSALIQNWPLCAISIFSFLLTMCIRVAILRSRLATYLSGLSAFKMLIYEMFLPVRNLNRIIRYKMTDKLDFICHKV